MSHGVEVCQTGGQRTCALRTPDGQFLTAEVSTQAWNQRVKVNTDGPQGVAALSGTLGPRPEKGFTLATPGLQGVETRAKVADATPLTDTPPPPRRSLSPRRPRRPRDRHHRGRHGDSNETRPVEPAAERLLLMGGSGSHRAAPPERKSP